VPPALRDRERLSALLRASSAPAGLVQRARIVLLAADGASNTDIAARVGSSRQTVVTWRQRYVEGGLAGLADADRPGRPRVHDEVAVVVATLVGADNSSGGERPLPHSCRSRAGELGAA
jgi:DNA-binding CsgD family transcriptional regulator